MKILFFSVAPVKLNDVDAGINGFSWISSTLRVLQKWENVEIAISFISDKLEPEETCGNIRIIPIFVARTIWQRYTIDKISLDSIDEVIIRESIEIVQRCKPDIIHIFGTEWCFGSLVNHVDVPIIIHMQGFWNQYRNCNFLPGEGYCTRLINSLSKPLLFLYQLYNRRLSKCRAEREERILRQNTYFMGRTKWDKALVFLYNKRAKYFHVEEALRSNLLEGAPKCQKSDVFTLATIGSCQPLKGPDVALKTAYLLKQNSGLAYKWLWIGGDYQDMEYFEHLSGIKCSEVNIIMMGRKNSNEIKELLSSTNLYVQPSYADNSPNALCEAQCMGLPIIASYAGGIPSLFSDSYDNDLLVPINDPYVLASRIIELMTNEERMLRLGEDNRSFAFSRNNEQNVSRQLYYAYKETINDYTKC